MPYAIRAGTLIESYSPSVVVAKGLWIEAGGNPVTDRGVRAHAVALEDFSARDVAARNGIPPKKLAAVRFGFAEVVLGETVEDNSFVTCAAGGTTVSATPGDEVLAFMQNGGAAGARCEALVLLNHPAQLPAAGIDDLTAGTATATDCANKINAMLAALRSIGAISTATAPPTPPLQN